MTKVHLRVLLVIVILAMSMLGLVPQKLTASLIVQPLYSGLNVPVEFTFLPDGRIFFNEKNTGNIRVIASNGAPLSQPFATLGPLPPGVAGTEEGLLGITLDPHFDVNNFVYVYWTYYNSTNYKHSIISRFTANANNVGIDRTDIFDFTDPNPTQPPRGPTNHNGGYIKFGPDGKLYVEIGDFCSWDCLRNPLAQNQNNLAGKILRMNPDGSVPTDNPFSSLVYSYGYRNGVGMDFSPDGKLIATMAGPNCCDRIFFVSPGANLGWPNCGTTSQPSCSSPYTPSTYQWGSTVTPTGIAYSTTSSVLYFGEFNTGNLMQLTLTPTGTVAQLDIVATLGSGILAVERGLDGQIYFSTSNTIYRLALYTPVPLSSSGTVMLSAPTRTVYFIFPDSNIAHSKPAGVGYAQVTDWTALGYVYGAMGNMPQIIALDTNSSYIDPVTGAPKIRNSVIVLFGGRLVNSLVSYYEVNGISPLHWAIVGVFSTGTEYYYERSGTVAATMSVPVIVSGSQDMGLIEVFADQFGNTVFIFSGFGWKGTFVAGLYFKTVLVGSLSGLTDSWYFWRWQDVNGNAFPDSFEVNSTPVSHGI